MEYKGYKIEGDKTFALYVIKPMGRGTVPKELRGKYTSQREAMVAIDAQASVSKRGQKDGEGTKTS